MLHYNAQSPIYPANVREREPNHSSWDTNESQPMAKKDSQAVAELLPLRRSQSELPAPESDELLVLSLRARHPDAGTQLFDRYAPHVRRVLVRVMGPDSEILDLVHDVFVTALESVNRL